MSGVNFDPKAVARAPLPAPIAPDAPSVVKTTSAQAQHIHTAGNGNQANLPQQINGQPIAQSPPHVQVPARAAARASAVITPDRTNYQPMKQPAAAQVIYTDAPSPGVVPGKTQFASAPTIEEKLQEIADRKKEVKEASFFGKSEPKNKLDQARQELAGMISNEMKSIAPLFQNALASHNKSDINKYEQKFLSLLQSASDGAIANSKLIQEGQVEFAKSQDIGNAQYVHTRAMEAKAEFQKAVAFANESNVPVPEDAFMKYGLALRELETELPKLSNAKLPETANFGRMEQWHPEYKAAEDKLEFVKDQQAIMLGTFGKSLQELTAQLEAAKISGNERNIKVFEARVGIAQDALEKVKKEFKASVKQAENEFEAVKKNLSKKSPDQSDQAYAKTFIRDARQSLSQELGHNLTRLGTYLTATQNDYESSTWLGNVGAIMNLESTVTMIAQAGKFKVTSAQRKSMAKLEEQIEVSVKARHEGVKPKLKERPTTGRENLMKVRNEFFQINTQKPSKTIQSLMKAIETDVLAISRNIRTQNKNKTR